MVFTRKEGDFPWLVSVTGGGGYGDVHLMFFGGRCTVFITEPLSVVGCARTTLTTIPGMQGVGM